MAIVDFNSAIWSDPWFRKLSVNGKNLFIYLWTNSHKTISGIYPIDLETISFETGIPLKQCPQTLSILSPKVKYDYQEEVVWVVNHFRHQFMRTQKISDQIKTGLERNLLILKPHPFVIEFLEVYKTLNLEIWSIDGLQRVLLDPPGGGGGKGEGKDFNPDIKEEEKIILPDWLEPTLWEQFKEHRRAIKPKPSPHAYKINLTTLISLKEKGHDPKEIIEASIANGWKGFFEPKRAPTNKLTGKVSTITQKNMEVGKKWLEKQQNTSSS